MKKFQEIEGDLIALAKKGEFDVIAHGCNCFCTQKAGIALQMSKEFDTANPAIYILEGSSYKGDINKLGRIQGCCKNIIGPSGGYLSIVNCYTQYHYGKGLQLDYEALRLCLRKLNHMYKGKHIGLPLIGCGLAGGDKDTVVDIIIDELIDCDITLVHYNK